VTSRARSPTSCCSTKAFIRFTFSTNVALVLLVVSGAVGAYVEGLRDAEGVLLVPLTALQLLWINFRGDGPPALALALDRNPDVMGRAPRPASSGLLDRASGAFILVTGLFKGLLGVTLLVVMPLMGYAIIAIQTCIFLYESIAKLVSAYPARRLLQRPNANQVLHAAVGIGIGIQILTVTVPALRSLLGLSTLDATALAMLGGAVAATWGVAELANRMLRSRVQHRTASATAKLA
jgi:Ca2+-transporting ATPase